MPVLQQLQFGLDITALNADGTITLPMPTTVILDRDHVVRWIDVHPDYTTRSEADEILAAIDSGLSGSFQRPDADGQTAVSVHIGPGR